MSDTSKQELIEEAAKAIGEVTYTTSNDQVRAARAALAVFEQAHTPTDDELLDTYCDAVEQAMNEASARDGFGSNMSRESIVAGLHAVARRTAVQEPSADTDTIDGKCLSCLGECVSGYHCCENCEHALRERGEWKEPQGEPNDALMIRRPHVPYGPVGIPEHKADADYLDHAASSLEGGYEVGGSNVRATVVSLLRDTASALRAAYETKGENRD